MATIIPIRPSSSSWQRLINNTTRVQRYSNGSSEECTGLSSSARGPRRVGFGPRVSGRQHVQRVLVRTLHRLRLGTRLTVSPVQLREKTVTGEPRSGNSPNCSALTALEPPWVPRRAAAFEEPARVSTLRAHSGLGLFLTGERPCAIFAAIWKSEPVFAKSKSEWLIRISRR